MERIRLCAALLAACLLLSLAACRPAGGTEGDPDGTLPAETLPETETETEEVTEPPLIREPVDPPLVAPFDIPAYQSAASIFVYDEERGLLFRQGDLLEPLYPASTTKLIAALTALEICEPDDVFEAGDELYLVQPGASAAYITVGCSLSAEMLVEAMMLPSGCDASYVIAAGCGRLLDPTAATAADAVAVFVNAMNTWAERNGLYNSHFENPDGFHAEGHYSCMADLMRVSVLAMQNEIVAKYGAVQYDAVVYASGHTNAWVNTNKLLDPTGEYYLSECVGIKTGQTDRAGCCLLSCFRHEGRTVYVGVFGSPTSEDRFALTKTLAETFLPGVH